MTTNVNSVVAGFALTGSEGCSKITGCESANAFAPFTTSIVNTATLALGPIPYGILLQSRLVNNGTPVFLSSKTTDLADPLLAVWSPNGQYIAVADGSTGLIIYNASNPALPFLLSSLTTNLSNPSSVAWSPSGQYIAVTNGAPSNSLFIFNVLNPASPIFLSSITTGLNNPSSVVWSPNGQYIAVASQSNSALVIYNASNPHPRSFYLLSQPVFLVLHRWLGHRMDNILQ